VTLEIEADVEYLAALFALPSPHAGIVFLQATCSSPGVSFLAVEPLLKLFPYDVTGNNAVNSPSTTNPGAPVEGRNSFTEGQARSRIEPDRVERHANGIDDRAETSGAGAGIGAVVGGGAGFLTAAGVSKEDAHVYAEGIRRGGTLVTARVADADRAKFEAILNRASINIQDRGAAYRKAGWKEFDATATPYTADQVRRERELYR
jgi:hypothetical protein